MLNTQTLFLLKPFVGVHFYDIYLSEQEGTQEE